MHAKVRITRLIHILAKHETDIKARRRVLGRVPAKLNTRVTMTRSMLVLLRAEEMVKPPIRSMIVGENMVENTYLSRNNSTRSKYVIGQNLTLWQLVRA